MKTETRAVLAATARAGKNALLTHTVELDEQGYAVRALCNRVKADSLADRFASDPTATPTCPRCAAKAVRA